MTIKISFAEFTHTGKGIDTFVSIPLGVGQVAANAIKHLGDAIDVEMFKYPQDFTSFLSREMPGIAGFSNYMWNDSLNHEFARRIKEHSPHTITIFGGPNFPAEAQEQEAYLRRRPAIDFYVDGEGDVTFIDLFSKLAEYDFDVRKFKAADVSVPNTSYIWGDKFFHGGLMPRVSNLDDLPSPYLSGLMDQFFDEYLVPAMQTSRGCPYSCTFCHDGADYMRKTRRFSQERIDAEIEHISARTKVPTLLLADLNFGIFKQDLDTARKLAWSQEKYGWPKSIDTGVAKNHKERVAEISKIINGALQVGASVQSMDDTVLENIKRDNVPLEQLVAMARTANSDGTSNSSFSEIILCLPGDTKEKHMNSFLDMLELGIKEIRTYQFILLMGTEGATRVDRERFGYVPRFRVSPRTFGRYEAYGESFDAFEFQEVCVANNTMSFEDYLQCRDMTIVVEIFNNGGIFDELLTMLERMGISRSAYFRQLLKTYQAGEILPDLFKEFREDEARNFWESEEEMKAFLAQKGTLEKYMSGEYGTHQIFHIRSKALVERFDEVTNIAFCAVRNLLEDADKMDGECEYYLDELREYILLSKGNLLSLDDPEPHVFHFDFVKLKNAAFQADPNRHQVPDGLEIRFARSQAQRKNFESFYKQFGQDTEGLARIIRRMPDGMASLHRDVHYN